MAGAILTCPNCGKRNRVRASPEGVAQCAACGTKLPWLVEADQRSFNAEITASAPLVVDFWAPWSLPDGLPVVEHLAESNAGRMKVVKLNVDDAPDIDARCGVQGIPLLLLLRDGEEGDRLVGAAPESQLRNWLSKHLEIPA